MIVDSWALAIVLSSSPLRPHYHVVLSCFIWDVFNFQIKSSLNLGHCLNVWDAWRQGMKNNLHTYRTWDTWSPAAPITQQRTGRQLGVTMQLICSISSFITGKSTLLSLWLYRKCHSAACKTYSTYYTVVQHCSEWTVSCISQFWVTGCLLDHGCDQYFFSLKKPLSWIGFGGFSRDIILIRARVPGYCQYNPVMKSTHSNSKYSKKKSLTCTLLNKMLWYLKKQ